MIEFKRDLEAENIELQNACNLQSMEIEKLESENKRLREALEAYAFCARERNPGKGARCICENESTCHGRAQEALKASE